MAPDNAGVATKLTKANQSSRAYVTFLAGHGDYVKGVVGLAKGLRKVKAAYPLVVAVLTDVPEDHRSLLANQGCVVREIEPVNPPGKQNPFAWAHYALNYSKLRIWGFLEYNKMIYLDADVQVFGNIDHLFDLEDGYFYAVTDCICEMYGEHCSETLLWPEELGPEPPLYFNAGVFVFQPCISTCNQMFKSLKNTPPTRFAEQDFLNMFFKDTCLLILPTYNLMVAMLWRHPEYIELDKTKVVHYCAAGSKPWRYTGKEENMDREDIKMLVNKWWDIYNDESLDYEKITNVA